MPHRAHSTGHIQRAITARSDMKLDISDCSQFIALREQHRKEHVESHRAYDNRKKVFAQHTFI